MNPKEPTHITIQQPPQPPRYTLADRSHGWFELLENNVSTNVIGPEPYMLAVMQALTDQRAAMNTLPTLHFSPGTIGLN